MNMDENKKKWEKPELIDLYSVTFETTGAGLCNNGPYDSDLCALGTKATGAGCGSGTGATKTTTITTLGPQDLGVVGSCHSGTGPIDLPNR